MVQESKKAMRREMKIVLANLDQRWIAKAHSEVCHRLTERITSLPKINPGSRHVLAWIPCFQGEVDLVESIGTLLRDSIVYLPRIDDSGSMHFVQIADDWGAHIAHGPRGILQPKAGYGEPFSVSSADNLVAIIPGLAFDQTGQRLGRGAGYYDRFLATSGLESAIKIGVCWSVQIVPKVPTDPHDVRMDWICYERGVIQTETAHNG